MRSTIVSELCSRGVDDADVAIVELLYSELIGNVLRHSGGILEVALDLANAPVLHVLDRGPGFTCTTRLPASLMNEAGRGLFILSSLAREFTVLRREEGGAMRVSSLPTCLPSRFQRLLDRNAILLRTRFGVG